MTDPSQHPQTDDEFFSCPVLVYGPRKAGTTLVQSMLDGGSAMRMVPDELKLKSVVRAGWPGTMRPARWFVERGRSFFPELFQISADGRKVVVNPDSSFAGLTRGQLEEIIDLDRYAAGLSKLLEEDPAEMGDILRRDAESFVSALKEGRGTATRWGSKEVGGDSAGILALFRRCFPNGKVVFVVRQPEFIVRSIILNRRRKGKRMSVRSILHECFDAQNVVQQGYEEALGGKAAVVIYEQLTESPAEGIEKLCGEIGLPCEPVNTGPTTLGRPVVVITSSRKTTEVFRQEADWRKDLTTLQTGLINLFRISAPLIYLLKGKPMIPYSRLRDVVAGSAIGGV